MMVVVLHGVFVVSLRVLCEVQVVVVAVRAVASR